MHTCCLTHCSETVIFFRRILCIYVKIAFQHMTFYRYIKVEDFVYFAHVATCYMCEWILFIPWKNNFWLLIQGFIKHKAWGIKQNKMFHKSFHFVVPLFYWIHVNYTMYMTYFASGVLKRRQRIEKDICTKSVHVYLK